MYRFLNFLYISTSKCIETFDDRYFEADYG